MKKFAFALILAACGFLGSVTRASAECKLLRGLVRLTARVATAPVRIVAAPVLAVRDRRDARLGVNRAPRYEAAPAPVGKKLPKQ